MDTVDRVTRSRMMSAIRPKDTQPELRVRRAIHAAGLRFRVHNHSLPGRPDLVFPSFKTIVFIHGCFWHRHACPKGQSVPASNVHFWQAKFDATVRRDVQSRDALSSRGWRVIVVWECEINDQLVSDLVSEIRRGDISEVNPKNRIGVPGSMNFSKIRHLGGSPSRATHDIA
jgi:DNA mismatch endonuclease (patch repair protein)